MSTLPTDKEIDEMFPFGHDNSNRQHDKVRDKRNGAKRLRDYLSKQIPTSMTLDTLQKYNEFLLKHGYTDTDIISEEPTAIDQFLEEQRKKDKTTN